MHAEARAEAHAVLEAEAPVVTPPPTAAQLARRQQFRRIVSGVVGMAAALAAVMMMRVATAPKQSELARLELPPMPHVAAPTTAIATSTADLPPGV